MKKIFYILLILPFLVLSQSPDQNWVKSKTYKVETNVVIPSPNPSQALTQVNYFDGLGRATQQVLHAQSNSGKDIVSHIEYDGFGRIEKEFLPYANQSASLNYNASASTEVMSFYNTLIYENTSNPFSQKQFEVSPLNRVIKQAAPGEAWKMNSGHEIKLENRLNEQNDLVYKFIADRLFDSTNKIYNYTLVCSGYHPNNSLYKSIIKNENWTSSSGKNNTTEEYKDNFGRVILRRTFNNSIKHDTYYVYDSIGNLIYILPPTLSDEIVTINPYQVPFVYNNMFNYNDFLLSCNGSNVVGGGGLYVKIQNSFFVCHFDSSFTTAKIDLTKTFFLELPNLVPNQDLINFYGYTLYIENNTLKFRLNTVQQNCFTALPNNVAFAFSLNSTLFANTTNYSATVNQALLQHTAYQYKYDYRNRLVEKKIPSKQWEYIVYDKLDRVVATGPAYNPYGGNDTSKGWLISKYDVFNRLVYTAWYNSAVASSTDRKVLQESYNLATLYSENKTVSATNINGISTKYTNNVTPSSFVLLTINYYDNYDYPNAPVVPTSLPDSTLPIVNYVKGLPTGSWIRVLDAVGSSSNELSYTFYDIKFRPVRSYNKNYLGGYTQVDSKLDWAGKIIYTVNTHSRLSNVSDFIVKERFYYSDQDRLVKHTHEIVGYTPEELIALNEYNELGQLINKRIGGDDISGTYPLQKIDFEYNIRGWLKSINNVDDLNESIGIIDRDLFAFKINYNKPDTSSPLFNGNISETFWKTDADNVKRKYAYQYDNLNRLLEANYDKPEVSGTLDNYLEKLSYDKNGNILSLQRNGNLDPNGGGLPVNEIDDLIYIYDTNDKNLLKKVKDNSTSPQGFKDGINSGDDYSYDLNGNMLSDNNKNISEVHYNHLNLPIKIKFDGTTSGTISYIYNSLGQKVKKVVKDSDSETITDYLNGFQYKNTELQFFPHTEGYVHFTKPLASNQLGAFNYIYNYTDHLGNVRLSFAKDPEDSTTKVKILEENHYYAFGMKHQNYNIEELNFEEYPNGVVLVPLANVANKSYNYKYNGKELQDELGLNMYDYGARNYDPSIGRFFNVDPMAESHPDFTPYSYVLNNPLRYIDPTGMIEEEGDPGKKSWFGRAVNTVKGWFSSSKKEDPVSKSSGIVTVYGPFEYENVSAPVQQQSGYPGQVLEELAVKGLQSLGELLSGDEVSTGTANNVSFGINLLVAIASKGKNKEADKNLIESITATELPKVVKAVNSNMAHAVERGLEREIFANKAEATSMIKNLTNQISKNGFPSGAFKDPDYVDRVLVPIGNGGLAAYQIAKNGTAAIKTILIAK